MQHPFASKPFFILGPCVIESERLTLSIAETLAKMADDLKIKVIFKASYDKANRSASKSFRGLGIDQGLAILEKVRQQTGLLVLTDVHTPEEAQRVGETVDMLQIPAMLCRQTDLIQAAAKTGKPVNYKKGQFLSPYEMKNIAEKAKQAGAADDHIFLCERGFSFGYNNLVVDIRSLAIMRSMGYSVVFDATHSVQLPGAGGDKSAGERQFIPVLARAAVAAGTDGVFMETHPEPEKALSDAENSWPLAHMSTLLKTLLDIHAASHFHS